MAQHEPVLSAGPGPLEAKVPLALQQRLGLRHGRRGEHAVRLSKQEQAGHRGPGIVRGRGLGGVRHAKGVREGLCAAGGQQRVARAPAEAKREDAQLALGAQRGNGARNKGRGLRVAVAAKPGGQLAAVKLGRQGVRGALGRLANNVGDVHVHARRGGQLRRELAHVGQLLAKDVRAQHDGVGRVARGVGGLGRERR